MGLSLSAQNLPMGMTKIHINIGSNIDRQKNISNALRSVELSFDEIKVSSIYSSPAEGFDGDDFYNMGVNAITDMTISDTIDRLHDIEREQGRDRTSKKFSSRIIDLDLVFYGDDINPEYNIPREDILKYAFVLAPLAELNQQHLHPIEGLTYGELWEEFQSEKKFGLIKYNADKILE